MQNKTDFEYKTITGKLVFPSINVPNFKFNKNGVWETFLIPDDDKELATAKDLGIRTKSWDDIPEAIYFKRFTTYKNGSAQKPPLVKNADGELFSFKDEDSGREIIPWTNTEAKLMYHFWETKNDWGTYKYYLLDGVRILNLVEKPESNSDMEEALDF
jgi:hypothetical protein